ncbi:unnamed protein product [Paramecium sonneborni]|uniref:Uncharacterized protein n=1 Tax=Paramecium sonneborni TaxID=65129 RepID=A0A8S1P0W6_9CILI|nr:unnamed protein product [Paramecium sonneborni]
MNNSSILNQSYCKTEGDECIGSRALDILKEKIKIFDLEKIPQLTQLQRERMRQQQQQRSKTTKYQIHSNSKQPTSYSQYRISNKKQTTNKPNEIYSRQTMESIKNILTIHEAKLLDVPIIKISREKKTTNQNDSFNTISLILMEKYYQSTLKYQERQSKFQQFQQPSIHINSMTSIVNNNQAVKNYKRKLRNSRRDLIKEIPQQFQQYKILNHSRQFSSDKSHFDYCQTNQIKRNHSAL